MGFYPTFPQMNKVRGAWQLVDLFHAACVADIRAIKPGNVGVHGEGHGMIYQDFIKSANLCAEPICAPNLPLGKRIFESIVATRADVPYNTNLGIVLLCAPLIQAIYLRRRQQSLHDALATVLATTTVDDAVYAYKAIRFARAGNLATVEKEDIADNPSVTLRQAMHLARNRDMIAKQYINDYSDIFDFSLPLLLEFRAKWGYNAWPATGVFLALLARYPDSLVTRKFGMDKAEQVRHDAELLYREFSRSQEPEAFKERLLAMDEGLKKNGLNPGTTADFTVATVFVSSLDMYLNET